MKVLIYAMNIGEDVFLISMLGMISINGLMWTGLRGKEESTGSLLWVI